MSCWKKKSPKSCDLHGVPLAFTMENFGKIVRELEAKEALLSKTRNSLNVAEQKLKDVNRMTSPPVPAFASGGNGYAGFGGGGHAGFGTYRGPIIFEPTPKPKQPFTTGHIWMGKVVDDMPREGLLEVIDWFAKQFKHHLGVK
jgi:hypothetical protein